MNQIIRTFLKFKLTILFLSGLGFNSCYANFTFVLRDSFNFTKNNYTIEHLDKNEYKKAAYTSDWRATREFSTYLLDGRVIWSDPSHFYALLGLNYGWVLGGKNIEGPNRWDVCGHATGFKVEAGYIMDVCGCFNFIPSLGFRYALTHTEIKHQRTIHSNPNCYAHRSGDKTDSLLYFPFIGFELASSTQITDCEKIQLALGYELGYGGGHSHVKVPHIIITDNPATSRYGSHVKFRDMVYQQFSLATSYAFAKHWQVGLEFDYSTTYNTHRLPVRLQHNERIIKAGQYTRSQRHVMSQNFYQTFSVVLGIAYSFGEGGGTWITR